MENLVEIIAQEINDLPTYVGSYPENYVEPDLTKPSFLEEVILVS